MVGRMRKLLVTGILNNQSLLAAAIGAGAVVGRAGDAHAFAEDLCYAQGGGPLVSCAPLPEVCRPAGTQTVACKAAIIAVAAHQRNASDGGRSSVHTDVTYLL